ncbi:MAG: hypothetical protein AB7M12_10220 [Hyphomonadaceae bacterium]
MKDGGFSLFDLQCGVSTMKTLSEAERVGDKRRLKTRRTDLAQPTLFDGATDVVEPSPPRNGAQSGALRSPRSDAPSLTPASPLPKHRAPDAKIDRNAAPIAPTRKAVSRRRTMDADIRPKLISVSMALKRYSVGRTKFYELLAEGRVSAVKAGAKTLVDVEKTDAHFNALAPEKPTSDRIAEPSHVRGDVQGTRVSAASQSEPVAYSIDRACALLGIKKNLFYEEAKREGGLRITKIGRRSVVLARDLLAYVDGLSSR